MPNILNTTLTRKSSNHSQPAVTVLNPLIQPNMVAYPPTPPIPKLRLQHPPPINQPDIPRARPEIAAPSPPQTPIRIRQASIQIDPTLTVVPVDIATLSHERAAVVF